MNKVKKITAAMLSSAVLLTAISANMLPVLAAPLDTTDMAVITLDGDSIKAEGDNITVDGAKVTITASGSYLISGTLDDGQIIVNVPDETADPGTVKLFFNGVTITGKTAPALYVINAENTSINIMESTENTLSDGEEAYTENGAVIYAKDDITIKSAAETEENDGKLTIQAMANYGIHCNNDVKISGGNIKVKTEAADAIRGKTSVEIKGGKLDINAGGDGIKSTKGDVIISGGKTEIKAANDAVQGETSVQISDGKLKANGDRSLTNAAGAVSITGGTILATATDNQVSAVESTQPTLMFQMAEEQLKDQQIKLFTDENPDVFSMKPDKKFDYVPISSADLEVGKTYSMTIGGDDAGTVTLTDTVTTLEAVSVTHTDTPARLPYDVNGDGFENVADAVILARIAAEDQTLPGFMQLRDYADVNGDGLVTAADLTRMLLFLGKKLS